MRALLPLRSSIVVVIVVVLVPFITNPRGVNSSSDAPLTSIPLDLYHTSDALLKEIKSLVLRHPDTLSMETVKMGNRGYAAEVLVVTYDRKTKHDNEKSKFRILMSFGQHGRELITSEVALQLLSVLAEEHNILSMGPVSITKELDNIVIKVVPMENLNGRKLVEAGDLCERRNGRGVDLNRNWGVDWGKKEKDYDPYEENPGTAPFSEPEAQIMRQLAKSFEPHIWVNVHSGMEALFMPYDHKNTTPDGHMSNLMEFLLWDVNRLHFEEKCLVGSGGGLVGYLAHGTTTDYMYDVVKVPMAFTFEIYGDSEASSKDCFKMFNPVDKLEFNKAVNKWSEAFLTLFRLGPSRLATTYGLRKWDSMGGKVIDGSLESNKENKIDGLDLVGVIYLPRFHQLYDAMRGEMYSVTVTVTIQFLEIPFRAMLSQFMWYPNSSIAIAFQVDLLMAELGNIEGSKISRWQKVKLQTSDHSWMSKSGSGKVKETSFTNMRVTSFTISSREFTIL